MPTLTSTTAFYLVDCYINFHSKGSVGIVEVTFAFLLPLFLILSWNIYSTVKSIIILRRNRDNLIVDQKLSTKLIYFPIIMIFCYSIDVFMTLAELFEGEKTYFSQTLRIFFALQFGSMGILNALYFGFGNSLHLIILYSFRRKSKSNSEIFSSMGEDNYNHRYSIHSNPSL